MPSDTDRNFPSDGQKWYYTLPDGRLSKTRRVDYSGLSLEEAKRLRDDLDRAIKVAVEADGENNAD